MSFSFTGLDHIQLAGPKGCEEDARWFFGKILGLKELEKPLSLKANGGVWFTCGRQAIHVGVESVFEPAKKAHPAILVENLEELRDHLLNNDIVVIDEDRLPGYKRFYSEDPFGNRIEFLEKIV